MVIGQTSGILLVALGSVVVVEGLLRQFSRYPNKEKPKSPKEVFLEAGYVYPQHPSKDLFDQSRQPNKDRVKYNKVKNSKPKRNTKGQFTRKSV